MNINNLNFRASSNPIKASFDIVRNLIAQQNTIWRWRRSNIIIFGWIIIGAIFLTAIVHSPALLLVFFVLTIGLSVLYFTVYLRVIKLSTFDVRAIYFNSDKGFELRYRDNTRRFVEYNNVVGLTLESKLDRSEFLKRFFPILFWPKVVELEMTSHFLLIVKEQESQKEIPIPLDIAYIDQAINLIKNNSHTISRVNTDIKGVETLLFVNRSLSRRELFIVLLVIFGFAVLVAVRFSFL